MSNCIALNHADYRGRSWCGRDIVGDWTFTSLDHAALSQARGQSVEPCAACVKAAATSLTSFGVTPPGWDRKVPRKAISGAMRRMQAWTWGSMLEKAGRQVVDAVNAQSALDLVAPIRQAEDAVAGLWAVVAADDEGES